MPLMISCIGHARGRPVPFAAGRWGSITRHSSSVTSVWYRLALRLCFLRVVGVHMATPGLVSEPPWNHVDTSHSTPFETASDLGIESASSLKQCEYSLVVTWVLRVRRYRISNGSDRDHAPTRTIKNSFK